LTHWLRLAASRAACTAGNSKAIRTPMIAMTTKSSIKVNPDEYRRRLFMSLTFLRNEAKGPNG
jgi:hypothetical protein